MGDPHSPGMTLGTCAWMEHEWLQSMNGDSQSNFKARRYMDDLLVFYARNDSWDEARFLQDIGGHCYLPPLKLEDGTAGTFLETSFEITGNTIRHWLKNENVTGEPPKIWRNSHFDSHGQFSQKEESNAHGMPYEGSEDGQRRSCIAKECDAEGGRVCQTSLSTQDAVDRVHDDGRQHAMPCLVSSKGTNSLCVSRRCIPKRSKGR